MSDLPILDIVTDILNRIIARGGDIVFLGESFIVRPSETISASERRMLVNHAYLVMRLLHLRTGKYFDSFECCLCEGLGEAEFWVPRELDKWLEDLRNGIELDTKYCEDRPSVFKLVRIGCPLCYPSTPLNMDSNYHLALKVRGLEFEDEMKELGVSHVPCSWPDSEA